ncbi:MAG TPA: hypothetical protein VFV02_00665 [Acidimicrobiales bacterium]|nr:hypothetical protein [Acidimicrobiales bacterium]
MKIPNDNHSIRRIVLPSGRSIEVVRFGETDNATRQLHVCPWCDSHLVQPIAWSEERNSRWQLTLECPNCSWIENGVFDRRQVEELEDRLDEGLAEMIADLQRLAQANMAEDIDRFADALQRDLVLPEDF